jgi:hypothetical protein
VARETGATDLAAREATPAPPLALANGRRVIWTTLAVATLTSGAIWLLVFDMWLGQAERQYLWENAAHELHIGPAVSLKAMMDAARASGAWVATAWGLVVAVAIAFAAWQAWRQGLRAGRRRV